MKATDFLDNEHNMTKVELAVNDANLSSRVEIFCIIERKKTEIRDSMIKKVEDGLLKADEAIFYIDETTKILYDVQKQFKEKIKHVVVD